MDTYQIHTFNNGIRLIHLRLKHSKVVHCGYIINTGSRDEQPGEEGLAHFWEHMVFKGTQKRRAHHILNALESLGGELNAYTTKEKVCFYATVLPRHFNKAADVLTDICFNSTFPEKEIEKERGVILEEMALYYDTPDEAISDDFDAVVFGNHPLGTNVLGTKPSVKQFGRGHFEQFLQRQLHGPEMVFSVIGDISFDHAVKIAGKQINQVATTGQPAPRHRPTILPPQPTVQHRGVSQAHCVMGCPAMPLNHPDRLPFILLNNILGGPGMTARLNLALRERRGYVYAIDSAYGAFTDVGLFSIYFATEASQLKKCQKLVRQELDKICQKTLGPVQLRQAREQLLGQIAMGEENNLSLMLAMGKSLIDHKKVDTFEQLQDRIKAITATDLLNVAQQVFQNTQLHQLVFLPKD